MLKIDWEKALPDPAKVGLGVAKQFPFSDLQWYLNKARNTVYLAAESDVALSEKDLHDIAGFFMKLAPQLHCKADGKGGRHVVVDIDPKSICTYALTDDLDKSLAAFISENQAVYSDPDLPNFRACCYTLVNPKVGEPKSLCVFSSSHALMEGSESARVMRLRQSVHNADQASAKLGILGKSAITIAGIILAPVLLAASFFSRKDTRNSSCVVIELDRKSVKKLALMHGVRQRSILFSLPLFGLRLADTLPNRTTKKKQLISYTTLPDTKTTLEDPALNLRMQVEQIRSATDYATQVQIVEDVLSREDTKEIYSQAFYNSILGVHRKLHSVFPFLYGPRFFNYVPYDFVLSLLPPHVAGGVLGKVFGRSIYCGSYIPGANTCVFVPYRNGISLNLYVDQSTLENMDAFMGFLEGLGISCRRVV